MVDNFSVQKTEGIFFDLTVPLHRHSIVAYVKDYLQNNLLL